MSLTVLSVAYPLAPAGPDETGGAEQVLTALDAALVDAGHRSLIVASAESRVRGELFAIRPAVGPFDEEAKHAVHHECRKAIARILRERHVDIVHMHGVDFHAYMPPSGVPVLATLHLPVSWYPAEIFDLSRGRTFLNCVSGAQNAGCPPCEYLLPPIANGVAMPPVRRPDRTGYALAIGRICPEKGFHLACDAADRARIPLVLAGKVFPYQEHETYFRTVMLPRLRRPHSYVGPVGREAKLQLYANARCLLVSSTVAETSSLVSLEALACGTPVVAFRTGALPDIVEHGRTGFLAADVDEMSRAIARTSGIDPEDCRRAVRERFSLEQMTARYLEAYRRCCAA